MLEEALNNAAFPPADAALALLSFLQGELPAGGPPAETRFATRLFSLLCDRVFGPMTDAKDKYRHRAGGWLSRELAWDRPHSSTSSSPNKRLSHRIGVVSRSGSQDSKTLDEDPVVKLLGTAVGKSYYGEQVPQTFVEAIAKEGEYKLNYRFRFPFEALPKPMQESWLAILQESFISTTAIPKPPIRSINADRLIRSLLRNSSAEQHELREYERRKAQKVEQKRPLQLGQLSSPLSAPLRIEKPKDEDQPPNAILSMLEYYLFLFVRFPLAAPQSQARQDQRGINRDLSTRPSSQRNKEPFGETVYLHIFLRYLRYFLPYSVIQGDFVDFVRLSLESELFLRILIEFWFNGHVVVAPTNTAILSVQERHQRLGTRYAPAFDLSMSYDLVQGKFIAPPIQVQVCARRLVRRVVADPSLFYAIVDRDVDPAKWCLSPAMTILQEPFFNFVRSSFRYASIHTRDSPFFAAMESWLMWLEPWNIKHTTKKNATSKIFQLANISISRPREINRSNYHRNWEPYVAANLHLYTVPFAIFLRRARELDFSEKEFHRSMKVLQRVFRVYTPEVIDAVCRLQASPLARRHEEFLGVYAPSFNSASTLLSSCGDDMQNLLEEIYMQRRKTLLELGMLDRVFAFFGVGEVAGEQKIFEGIQKRAKEIVGLPDNYEVRLHDDSDTQWRGEGAGPARTGRGELTDEGRQQILSGASKCDPIDILNLYDPMTARVRSHEIPFLVPLSVYASKWLNQQLGLGNQDKHLSDDTLSPSHRLILEGEASQKSIRVNLRFLADYRNLLFICVLGSLFYMRLVQG